MIQNDTDLELARTILTSLIDQTVEVRAKHEQMMAALTRLKTGKTDDIVMRHHARLIGLQAEALTTVRDEVEAEVRAYEGTRS